MARARDIPGLQAGDRFDVAARKVVSVRVAELLEHADRVHRGGDPAAVFDTRVASRRLRAALEIFERAFDRERHRSVLRDVKRLADALGARRDPDAQIEALEALRGELAAEQAPALDALIDELRAERDAGDAVVAEALAQARASDLAGRLRALVEVEEEEQEAVAS